MGVSVLHRYFSNEFRRINEIAGDSDLTILEAEESVLGVTHADMGGWLAERWNLPDHLIEAITTHHVPTKAMLNPDLVALIHVADVFALRLHPSRIDFDKGIDFDPGALARLQLSDPVVLDEYLDNYRSVLEKDIEQVTSLAGINGF
jgi:HD-like signal output (HDOD) protein